MYKLYGPVMTRTSRVIWMLEEIGAPYELEPAAPRTPEIWALNPSGKVPVLIDGDRAISDSSAITTYLADKHGALTYPAGTLERAEQDALFHTILDEIDAVLWVAARHSFILPEDKRVPAIRASVEWEFDRNFQRLEKRFKGPFLMGDKMTIADILLIHCMSWARNSGFPLNSDVLSAYGKEMRARPAHMRMAEMAAKA
ncbi:MULTISPECIES: glutathione S-transferase family protein [unclassified Ruegeria]|uniref:glutathione S-transferase family protein n=1 Tax=unclassified Ruegeria TaxID=2625375 RepID=UPI001489E7CF|nr:MULTISPECIES: glutathione S-transferase family protein [unclassified Ruegeria]